MIPDYGYYTSEYLGNQITAQDFPRLIARAGDYLATLPCVNADAEKLKKAACAVAEAWQVNEQGGDVASQSVGSWSKTFTKAAKPKSDAQRLMDAAKLYLGDCVSVRWC